MSTSLAFLLTAAVVLLAPAPALAQATDGSPESEDVQPIDPPEASSSSVQGEDNAASDTPTSEGADADAQTSAEEVIGEGSEAAAEDVAQREGIEGEVVLDLLIDPEGEVAQVIVISSPAPSLGEAASIALRQGDYEAARMGKYPLWAWLRIPVRFGLKD